MKKIILLILMLTFLLIPTCVNANAVSWEDFVTEVQKTTDRNVEEDLNNFSGLSTFKSQYNSCYAFYVFGNFGFTSDSPDNVGADKLYFYLSTDSRQPTSVLFNSNGSSWNLALRYYNYVYTYDLTTGAISSTYLTGYNRTYITYNLNEQNQSSWSAKKFNSETGLNYFLTTSYVLGWNATAECNYYTDYPEGNTNVTKDLTSLNDSDWPWDDTGSGGDNTSSGDTYYNYDFGEYFQKPYLKIFDTKGYLGNINYAKFFLYSQSGDEYYPFDKLKLDLVVYKVTSYTDPNNPNAGGVKLNLVDTYKNFNGDYLGTSDFLNHSIEGKFNVYEYSLLDSFGSDFLNQYISSESSEYAFQVKLHSFWGDELSSVKIFYCTPDSPMNNFDVNLDNYYNNNFNNGNLNLDSYDFTSILDTTKNFLSSVFGVFVIFPDWLVYLLAFGITVAIILRILGR